MATPMAEAADGAETAGARRGRTGTAMAATRVRRGGAEASAVTLSCGAAAALGHNGGRPVGRSWERWMAAGVNTVDGG